MATKTYKKMEELTEKAKSKDIISVAERLSIKLTRTGQSFKGEWAGHDSFSFNPRKNTFDWYGRGLHGDSIDLVKTIKDVNFKGAVAYLNEIDVDSFDNSKLPPKEKFSYYLKDNEDIQELNQYLIEKRGLSDDTVSFFISAGILSQSTWRTTLDSGEYFYEPVAVFKQINNHGAIDGASVQGFYKNEKIHKAHKSGHLKRIMPKSDGYGGFALNIGTPKRLIIFEAPIDMMSYYDLHKEKLTDVKLVACDGYKPMAYARYIIEILNPTWVYNSTSEGQQDVYDRIQKIEEIIPNIEGLPQNFITFAYDNDAAGNQFIQQFRETYPNIGQLSQSDLPPLEEGQLKSDWNDYLQKNKKEIKNTIMNDNLSKTFSELKQELLLESQRVKKSPEEPQEKDNFSNKKERINGSMGSLPSENLEGSPVPDAKASFESTVTSDPTQSSRYLKFTTDRGYVSKVKQGYKIADPKDLNYLNRYAGVIQDTAQWYQEQLADSKVYYLYQDKDEVNILEVDYLKSNFTHLTGVFALDKKQTSEKTLDDLAAGKGHFNNLLVSYGYREKLQVLPLLPEIVESTSFVFNDLSDVPKMGQLNVEKAIQSEDKELLLAFRSADGKNFPASLLKTGKNFKNSLAEAADKKVILGVFQSKNDEIKQLSINTEIVKDRNLSLKDFLESSLQEQEIQKNELPNIENNIEKAENKAKSDSKSLSDILKSKDTHALTAHMKAGVNEYLNSDTYKNYLDAVSKFHRYSSKNIRLLLSQNQNISMVASYKDWKEKFERQVSKGSKSLKVYVPKIQKLKDDEGKVKLDPNGKEMTRTYFQLGSVFDVSQTTGKEIPKPVYQLEGEVKNYSNIYAALTKTTKAEIGFTDISTGAHGFYQPDSDIIKIQKGMKQEQTIKTVIHEIAHSNLHNLEARKKHEYTKEEKELQAESVAYVVSNHLGIDTSSYSFGYLANWSSDKNTLDHLESSMSIVRDEAAKIISRLDQELTQVKTKNVAKDSLEADIEKARLKQQQMEVSSQTKKEQSPIQDNQVQQKEPNKK
ncbi:PBECR4 domain-containing protein [Lactococcus garvieae]|uniref:PBECR4 domain-containing protein n=1 Tax=Lactococcus garvieae TaxID=1363 RepID=UPI0038551B5E